jgi:hypothetical protein
VPIATTPAKKPRRDIKRVAVSVSDLTLSSRLLGWRTPSFRGTEPQPNSHTTRLTDMDYAKVGNQPSTGTPLTGYVFVVLPKTGTKLRLFATLLSIHDVRFAPPAPFKTVETPHSKDFIESCLVCRAFFGMVTNATVVHRLLPSSL